MKNVIKQFKARSILWVVGIFSVLLFFGIYLYMDICHTTIRGVVFWETLFQGKIGELYSYHYPGVAGSWYPDGTNGGSYDFFIYVIFAIWDFPLWCFEKITGLSFLETYATRLYAKGISLFFSFASAFLVKRIIEKLGGKEGNRGVFFFLFSPLLISTIVIMGGYDIISVFFTLLGIWFYLEEKEIPFIASFAVAATCKMFALFIFVPLFLLKRKNIMGILIRILAVASLIIVPKLVVKIVKGIGIAGITGNGTIAHANIIDAKMFSGENAIIQMGNIPLFFAATFVLWWICWKKKETTKEEVIYIALVSMSIFAVFVDMHPYWIILLTPYIAIVMAINEENIIYNFTLEIIFSIGYLIYQICLYPWCWGLRLVNKMLDIPEGSYLEYRNCGIAKIIKRFSEIIGISTENIYSLFACCFVVGLGLFLYENRPEILQRKNEQVNDKEKTLYLDWIRIFVGIGVMLLPLTELIKYLV